MTTTQRINVTLDLQTSALLAALAEGESRSLSATAADLIRDALETHDYKISAIHELNHLKTLPPEAQPMNGKDFMKWLDRKLA